MLRDIFTILIILFAFIACNKQKDNPVPENQNLVFTGYLTSGEEKSTLEACNNPNADYALIIIDDMVYRPAVFYLGGIPFTEAIKLIPGAHFVSEFLLMNDAGTPGLLDDDFIVQAIPQTGSNYAQYVSNPVSFEIQVAQYDKTEVSVDVVCFNESDYEEFGFDWFMMNEITVRSQMISGTICVENPDDYMGSMYEGQTAGLDNQMPAIYKIDVYRNGAYLLTYDNENSLGEEQLAIEYPDHNNASDHFDFELSVLVKSCDGFYYRLVKIWSFDDNEVLNSGNDFIVDFVVGDGNLTADWIIPAYGYLRLPPSAKAKITDYGPGTLGSFIDFNLNQVDDGYSIYNDTWPGWNGDHSMVYIEDRSRDDHKPVDIYNSLCPSALPDFASQENKNWEAVNWLMNHLDQYEGYQWDDIQGALWLIMDKSPVWDEEALFGVRPLNELEFAQQMHDDALLNGASYVPASGEVAAAIIIYEDPSKAENTAEINMIFVELSQ